MASYPNCECTSNVTTNLSYDTPLSVDSFQIGSYEERVAPSHGMSNGPYEFVFNTQDSFLCMNSLQLEVNLKIFRDHETNKTFKYRKQENDSWLETLEESDSVVQYDDDGIIGFGKVFPVNNIINSLWQSIEVRINDVQINASSAYNIPYKSIIETVLSFEDERPTYLEAGGFMMDTPNYFENTVITGIDRKNLGACGRFDWVEKGHFTATGSPCIDFARANNHLAPDNKLTFRFTQAPHEFTLMSDDEEDLKYKLIIQDIHLTGRRIKLREEFLPKILNANLPQQYLAPRTEVKNYLLSSSVHQWSSKIYSIGESCPYQIIVGMVQADAYHGDLKKNPFNFYEYSINKVSLKINGKQYPHEGLSPNFEKKLLSREYFHLFSNCGKNGSNKGVMISPDHFQNGFTLFPFDLTPDKCNGKHVHPAKRNETIELELGFSTSLPRNVMVIVMGIFNQIIMIDPKSGKPSAVDV